MSRHDALMRLLDERVHELYLIADCEYPIGSEFDADARALHGDLVDNDPQCVDLMEAAAIADAESRVSRGAAA